MLNEPTTEKLQALRLYGMLHAWQEQTRQAETAQLGFDERFALLVEAEWLRRENERLVRNLREAKLSRDRHARRLGPPHRPDRRRRPPARSTCACRTT